MPPGSRRRGRSCHGPVPERRRDCRRWCSPPRRRPGRCRCSARRSASDRGPTGCSGTGQGRRRGPHHLWHSHPNVVERAGRRGVHPAEPLRRGTHPAPAHSNSWGLAFPGPFDYSVGIGRFRGMGTFEALEGFSVARHLPTALKTKNPLGLFKDRRDPGSPLPRLLDPLPPSRFLRLRQTQHRRHANLHRSRTNPTPHHCLAEAEFTPHQR